jgi:uncharacterized protein (DUF58 family)
VIEAAARAGCGPGGGTRIGAGIEGLLAHTRSRAVACLLSDFRPGGDAEAAGLSRLAARHDLVSLILHDPREESLPRAGLLRVRDPESSRTLLLDSSSARVRARYRRAWAARAALLERSLRSAGSDVLWLRTDRDPLSTLMRFFRARAARTRAA